MQTVTDKTCQPTQTVTDFKNVPIIKDLQIKSV